MTTMLGSIPVFMRVGDGPELEVGTIEPEVSDLQLDSDGTAFVTVTAAVAKKLPGFLRAVADEMEMAGA